MARPRFRHGSVVCMLGLSLMLTACSHAKQQAKEPTAAQLVEAGLAATNQGDDQAALSAFQRAASKDPNNFLAEYNMGTIHQKQGNTELALQDYAQALRLKPNYVPALYNSALIYGDSNPQLALSTYRKIVKLQPKAPTAYLNLGLLEAKLGLYALAGKDLQKALEQDPTLTTSIPKDVFKKSPTPSPSHS